MKAKLIQNKTPIKKKRKTSTKVSVKTSVTSMKRKAWKMFSKYIRLMSLTNGMYGKCYTCDAVTHYNRLQAGHWIEGRHNAVLLVPAYVRAQCNVCNIFRRGNQGVFRDRIRREIGDQMTDYLIEESKRIVKLNLEDYTNIYETYKRLVETLK